MPLEAPGPFFTRKAHELNKFRKDGETYLLQSERVDYALDDMKEGFEDPRSINNVDVFQDLRVVLPQNAVV